MVAPLSPPPTVSPASSEPPSPESPPPGTPSDNPTPPTVPTPQPIPTPFSPHTPFSGTPSDGHDHSPSPRGKKQISDDPGSVSAWIAKNYILAIILGIIVQIRGLFGFYLQALMLTVSVNLVICLCRRKRTYSKVPSGAPY